MKFNNEKLELILIKKGMLYRDLSKRTGISENAIRAIRHGEASPRLATIHKIVTALDIDPEEILDIEKKGEN